jgi:hypothetical protein
MRSIDTESSRDFGCWFSEVTARENRIAQREALDHDRRPLRRTLEVLIDTGGRRFIRRKSHPRAKIISNVKCQASGEAERNDWHKLVSPSPGSCEGKIVVVDRADWDFAKRVIAEYDLEQSPLKGQFRFRRPRGQIDLGRTLAMDCRRGLQVQDSQCNFINTSGGRTFTECKNHFYFSFYISLSSWTDLITWFGEK